MSTDNKPAAPGLVEAQEKIRGAAAFLESTLRTNSRDLDDWRTDVQDAVATIRAALSQPVPSAPEPSDAEGWMSRKDAEATAECLIAEGMAKIEEAERVAAVNAETVSRLHHALARHGWHPGRTDEPIADCVEKALAAGPAGPYPNKRAAPPVPAAAPAVEPVAWGIFDSQGFYEAAIDEETAKRFCTHYNKRSKDDPLRPYSFRPLFATLPASPEPATQGAAKPVHTNHPFQHWDRTCPACVLEASPPAPEPLTPAAGEPNLNLAWACERWRDEVQYRPLVNVHRRTLDHTWRQVIRHFGGNPVELLGPPHDELLAAMPAVDAGKRSPPESMGPWTGGTTWAALPTEKQGD